MTYEDAWKVHMQWLENNIELLSRQRINTVGKERERITSKLEGLILAYQYMRESEMMILAN